MRIRNLDTFYWIACLGSFRAASEKLNLTQPAVTARIQVLEQDLGAEVFVKDLKRTELTTSGRKLFGFAEQFMHLEGHLLAAFSGTTMINQTIRLGASETVATTWLPDFLGSLSQTHENLSFELIVDSTGNLRNALVARDVDLAFLMGPIAEVSIQNHDICAYEMVFAAAPELAQEHKIWRLEEIAKHPVLTFATDTKPSRQIREMLGVVSNGSPNMTTSTSLGAIIRLAISGRGICAIPRAVIVSEIESGQLAPIRTNVKLKSIAFTGSYVSANPSSLLFHNIIDQAVQFLKPHIIKNIYQN